MNKLLVNLVTDYNDLGLLKETQWRHLSSILHLDYYFLNEDKD